jgi:SAM-dependent methyltransferase
MIRTTLDKAGMRQTAGDYLFKVASHYLTRKIEGDPTLKEQIVRLEQMSSLATHYAHTSCSDQHALLHLKLYLAHLTRNLEARLKLDGYSSGTSTILDVGDPDGVVLERMGCRQGFSVNILKPCTEQILGRHGRPVQGDCEHLPFPDKAFDYVFCFETFEHLENPIQGLKDLCRVCKRKLFISIPWVKKTTIHEDNYTKDQPEPEHHIFEFDASDFARIVSHTPFRVTYQNRMEMFPAIYNPLHSLLLSQFYYSGFFPAFQFYELTPAA